MEKKRIEYIDLMKGICITLVVLLHCGFFTGKLAIINEYLKLFRMPLYFFLLGLFFKTYGGFLPFILKKINNLIIPYLFFSFLFYLMLISNFYNNSSYLSCYFFFKGFIEPYNYPLWFLRSLFFTNIIYYTLYKLTFNPYQRIISSFIISIFIWHISPSIKEFNNVVIDWIFIRQNLLTSFFVLPYIAIADYIKDKGWLSKLRSKFIMLIVFFIFTIALIIMHTENFDLKSANFGNNVCTIYISSFSGIFAVYSLSKILNKLYFFSYIGRYSIIVLGTHLILININTKIFPNIQPWLLSFIVLLSCPLVICILKKYFPYFTAQKNLIQAKK